MPKWKNTTVYVTETTNYFINLNEIYWHSSFI